MEISSSKFHLRSDGQLIISGTISGGGIVDHNDLRRIQGGDINQYYHLNQSNYKNLTSKNPLFDILTHRSRQDPGTPGSSSIFVYMTETGLSPNKIIQYKFKNELGQQIIIGSFIV